MEQNMSTGNGANALSAVFPFKLDDLKSWIVHRKDGTVTRFTLVQGAVQQSGNTTVAGKQQSYFGRSETTVGARVTSNYATYCNHKPGDTPSAKFTRADGTELNLWVASIGGAKLTKDTFDYIVDCGDIFDAWQLKGGLLDGDRGLVSSLGAYVTHARKTPKLLKIDWDDRQAPPVEPEFWVELNKHIKGDVMTACIGGHGRSGSSFVCLLLANAPDYDALDAVVHLRAVHCPRAIESQVQHEYINKVAEYLGRKANGQLAHTISDYKEAFRNSTKPTAIATRKYLGWDK